MTPVVLASAVALFRATLSSPDPLFDAAAPEGPRPMGGIWAALPADCAPPSGQDLAQWPKCATPIGFAGGEVAALQRPDPANPPPPGQILSIARTKYRTVRAEGADAPEIVEIDVPILFNRSTIYLALLPDSVDADGRFVSATGWPVGCPPGPAAGVTRDGARCTAETADAVRAAALARPSPDKLWRLVRIPEGAAPVPAAPAPDAPPSEEAAPEPPAASSPSSPPTAPPGVIGEAPLTPPATPAQTAPQAPPTGPSM